MKIRRVVTAIDAAGKSVFLSDGPSPREHAFEHIKGMVTSPLWKLNDTPDLTAPAGNRLDVGGSVLAAPGGAVFIVVTFPPDEVMMPPGFDPAKAGAENMVAIPGLAEKFESDHPGMHSSATVDFATVITGEIVLELDDGKTVALKAGDTVVQQGTRHAWRNPGSQPATVSFVMLGAKTA